MAYNISLFDNHVETSQDTYRFSLQSNVAGTFQDLACTTVSPLEVSIGNIRSLLADTDYSSIATLAKRLWRSIKEISDHAYMGCDKTHLMVYVPMKSIAVTYALSDICIRYACTVKHKDNWTVTDSKYNTGCVAKYCNTRALVKSGKQSLKCFIKDISKPDDRDKKIAVLEARIVLLEGKLKDLLEENDALKESAKHKSALVIETVEPANENITEILDAESEPDFIELVRKNPSDRNIHNALIWLLADRDRADFRARLEDIHGYAQLGEIPRYKLVKPIAYADELRRRFESKAA